MSKTLAAVVAVAALWTAPQGALAATWDASQLWSGQSRESVGTYSLGFAPDGTAIALVAPRVRGDRGVVTNSGPLVSTRPPGGPYSAPRALFAGLNFNPAGLVVDRTSRVVMLADVAERDPDIGDTPVAVRAYYGRNTTDGLEFSGSSQTLSRRPSTSRLIGNANGNALAFWFEGTTPQAGGRVRAALRAPGRRFRKPTDVSRGPVFPPEAALNQRGDAVIVWQEDGRINARIARRGTRFGKRVTVGRASTRPRYADQLSVALNNSGDIAVAWSRTASDTNSVVVSTSTRSGRFRRPTKLDDFARDPTWPTVPSVAGAPSAFVVAWNASAVRVAGVGLGDPSVQDAATGSAFPVTTVVAPDGTATIVWAMDAGVFARTRSPGGELGPTEQVAGGGSRVPRVALDPLSAQPTVVYSSENGRSLSVAERRP